MTSCCRPQSTQTDAGAAAVEFALIVPILTVLFFGVVEFGLAFNAQIALTQAVREGVRVEALDTGDPAEITRDAYLGAIGYGGGDLEFPEDENHDCPEDPEDDDRAQVYATFEYSTVLLDLGPFNLTGEAVMRCGG